MTLKLEDAYAAFWNVPGIKPFKLGEEMTAQQALEQGGLDWKVERKPLFSVNADGEEVAVKTHVANVRSDTQEVIGVVGKDYAAFENLDTMLFAEEVARQSGALWLGAGFTNGGSRVHALMALDRTINYGIEGEDILPLFTASNGHDGGLALRLRVAPMRLMCLNGMLIWTPVSHTWSSRHTKNLNARVGQAQDALKLTEIYMQHLQHQSKQLLNRKVSNDGFGRLLARLVPIPHDLSVEDPGGRKVKNAWETRAAILAQRDSPDLASIRDTAYGALQAVTAYATHDAPRRGDDAAFRAVTEPHPMVTLATRILLEV